MYLCPVNIIYASCSLEEKNTIEDIIAADAWKKYY